MCEVQIYILNNTGKIHLVGAGVWPGYRLSAEGVFTPLGGGGGTNITADRTGASMNQDGASTNQRKKITCDTDL